MTDGVDDESYRRMVRAARFQWFRVVAVLGAFVGASFGSLVAVAVAVAVEFVRGPLVVSLRSRSSRRRRFSAPSGF